MKQPSLWDDESRVSYLKQLWTEGLSASQIARVMGSGLTRNAVIGKAHRLGLEPRKTVRRYHWQPTRNAHS
jgi:GcrA cell cycle regulator